MNREQKRKISAGLMVVLLLFVTIVYLRKAEESMATSVIAQMPQALTSLKNGEEKVIYLTFDTAAGECYVEEILHVLRKQKVSASFAVLGDWIEWYPEEARLLRESGQGIFCHSMHHVRYTDLTIEEALADAAEAKTAIEGFFGANCHYIRPPYGAYHVQLLNAMEQLELQTLLWSVDAQDWKQGISSEEITERVVSAVKPGDIILFQTNCAETALALEQMIPILRQMGYQFAKLS